MSLVEKLKAAGFKPAANTDGEFVPLKGTYECNIVVLRPDIDKNNGNAKFYQLELKPIAAIEGDPFGEKFTFRKRYYVDGDKAEKNFEKLVNDLFTSGLEFDMTSDSAFEADFAKAIGAKMYVRSWGWTPEGKDSAVQQLSVIKAKVAEKKRTAGSLTF